MVSQSPFAAPVMALSLALSLATLAVGCTSESTGAVATADGGSADAQPVAMDGAVADGASFVDANTDAAPIVDASEPANDASSAADAGGEDPCTKSGGTVSDNLCCGSTSDFPNTCAIGACGCSPSNSHSVKVCVCPSSTCWNGRACAPR
jgi:hypothetical protein